ncbi:MAG: M1 family metallopeptidase [Candidatus Micrarchaeaceae archaeon]
MKKERYETLGNNVLPINYNIKFDTNLKTFKFKGSEKISVKISKPTKKILLNALELDLSQASVSCNGDLQDAAITYNSKLKQVALHLKKEVFGNAIISIEFTGINNDKLYGFYRSRYEENGENKYLLTSQFEAAYARAAFPCFDEPSFKATFDISIVIDDGLEAISNMPVKGIEDYGPNRKLVAFHTTPIMSSYLLYLGVGKYDRVSGKIGKTKVSVLTTPGKKGLAKLPLEYAKKFLAYFGDYFGIQYPLPKMDLLAIPDFSAGAMENWGAVTFREIALLGDEKSGVAVKQRIAEVIAHEFAHQWFGDLVTMKWWNDLWLNESFATFMSYKAMDAVFPEWDMKTQYFNDTIAVAFSADSLKSTHPISVDISTPAEIESIFDEISYEKGGTVLHMLEHYAGAEAFRRGLHKYLSKHAYGNATKYDLWGAVETASTSNAGRKDIAKVANYWIDEPGYPIIEARRTGPGLELIQKRFTILGEKLPKKQVWPIPVYYVLEGGNFNRPGFIMLDREKGSIAINKSKWAKLNYGQHYLYRVKYPRDMLAGLGKMINERKIKGTDSWGVENDLFALARSGSVSLDEYLGFVKDYCLGSADYPLNMAISAHLNWLNLMLAGKSQQAKVNQLMLEYYKGILERIGWEKKKGDDNITVMLRGAAVAGLGKVGHEPTIKKALALYSKLIAGGSIEPDLKSAVLSIAALTGDKNRYEEMESRYKKEENPEDKRRFLQCLGLFPTKELVLRSLKFAYTKDVRLQDSYILPAMVASNPVGKELIWDWTRKNWKFLLKTHSIGTHMMDRYVENLSSAYTASTRNEIAKFFAKGENARTDVKLTIKQSLERIDANIKFMKRNGIE